MKSYTNQEISDYYDQTEVHYKSAWDLEKSLALHYGFWRKDTRNFRESLLHMNEEMAKRGRISKTDKVLDAGCGVGGSAVYLAKNIGCQVTGITLSQMQVDSGFKNAATNGLTDLLDFALKDYTDTNYPDQSFDVIWALESVGHAKDKEAFVKEASRLLKPGGRIIIGEYYKKAAPFTTKEEKIFQRWLNAWAIADLPTLPEFRGYLEKHGFQDIDTPNITPNIKKSSWRMFYGSWYLTPLSALYRIYNPNVRYFADNHYKGPYYQYLALKRGLWQYHFVVAEKK